MNVLLALLLSLFVTAAHAQGCGQGNPNCVAPTPPAGDNSTRIANTAWVLANSGGGGGGGLVVGTSTVAGVGANPFGLLFNNNGVLGNTPAGASGAFLIGQGGSTPPAFNFLTGDCTAMASGAITCTKTNGTAFSNLATLASIASSTVLGNFSGGGTVSAQSVPSCANDGGHALANNAGAGFNCVVIAGSSISLVVGTTPVTSGISLGLLYNNAGILGNTAAPTAGQIIIGQSAAAPLFQTMSGDCTIAATGAITCLKTNGTNFGGLATLPNIATSTVVGNFSGGTLAGSAQSVPTCANDGAHALTNNAGGGFNCAAVGGSGSTLGPTEQKFTSGSGTYTTPANVVWIEIRMVGGGGGGGGVGATTAPNGATGGDTTFGAALLVGNGGLGGTGGAASNARNVGGNGGAAALGVGPLGIATQGNAGGNGVTQNNSNSNVVSGQGGASCLGGAPASVVVSGNGISGATNSGAGGGGAVSTTGGFAAGGGGSAGCVKAIIVAPSATYAYAVGAGGLGGIGTGTNAFTGGQGGSGIIDVIEHYNH